MLQRLRSQVRTGLQAYCNWDYLRSKNSPNGASACAKIDFVSTVEYAALIGRAADPELKSLVKNGAWYSVNVAFDVFFGDSAGPIRGHGGKYGGNSNLSVYEDEGLVVKYSPAQQVMTVSAYIAQQ